MVFPLSSDQSLLDDPDESFLVSTQDMLEVLDEDEPVLAQWIRYTTAVSGIGTKWFKFSKKHCQVITPFDCVD